MKEKHEVLCDLLYGLTVRRRRRCRRPSGDPSHQRR